MFKYPRIKINWQDLPQAMFYGSVCGVLMGSLILLVVFVG